MINSNIYGYQPAQPVQANNMPTWVAGEAAAKSYLVAPNGSVFLMDSERDTFYIKSTDASGMPLPLRIFDYKERTSTPAAKPENFVTREEFEKRLAELAAPRGKKVKDDE